MKASAVSKNQQSRLPRFLLTLSIYENVYRVLIENYINDKGLGMIGPFLAPVYTGDNHVTCGQLSKPDVATLSYRRSHYWWEKER